METNKLIQELVGLCVEKSNERQSVNFHYWGRINECRVSIRRAQNASHDDSMYIMNESQLQAAIDKVKAL